MPRFPLGELDIDPNFYEELVHNCGREGVAGVELGTALHDHAAGVWGSTPEPDRRINEFVLSEAETLGYDRWIISRHVLITGDAVEIATNLSASLTLIRSCSHPVDGNGALLRGGHR